MGFYSEAELAKTAQVEVDISDMNSECMKCGLYNKSDCTTPKMEYSGKGKKGILIVGEFSTYEDDTYGIQFSGEDGDVLKDILKQNKIKLISDCWSVHAVRCSSSKIPNAKQIRYCAPYIKKLVKTLKPKVVWAMGDLAINSLFGNSYSNRTSERWRRYCIPDEEYGCNVVPMYHPSRLTGKGEKDKNMRCLQERDIKFGLSCVDRKFKKRKDYEGMVKPLTNFIDVRKKLKFILKKKKTIAYDYEATGLKPFRKGHKIVSIGFATSKKKAYAFPYDYNSHWTKKELKVIKRLWTKILADDEINKIAHNEKFESIWSKTMFDVRPKHSWDTMMAEHILDNRSQSTSLKFQTFVNYGVRPYDEFMTKYLKSKNGEFNQVEKAPLKELLLYNGLDGIFTMMRYKEQIVQISKRKGLLKAYNFFMKGNHVMGTLQLNGLHVDVKYYQRVEKKLTKKIRIIKKRLEKGREARTFKRKFGRPLKITSNKDLGLLFYEVLGKDPVYTNEKKENYKTDKLTLEGLNLPFVDKLLEMKKWTKAKDTYLAQFKREIVIDKMYPFFDLNIPVSYRGSSSRPNFQNLPKRDDEVKKVIRMGLIPSIRSRLSEIDFSGAEVITSVTYHGDKNFYNYLVDKTTDMHRDNATDLLILPKGMLDNPDMSKKQKKLAKKIRFFAKNNWTFAQFYGDYFGSCAPTFWENVVEAGLKLPNGMTARKWLRKKGITELGEMTKDGPTEGSFMEHCAKVEDKMWNERFPEYTQWKKDIVEFYQKYGYIENHFGFRFVGYMGKNQCTNFPIQSASFHLLVYTLIQVDKFIKKKKLKTKLIGNIHDSIIADVPDDETIVYHAGVEKIVSKLQKKFKWLTVPMEVEMELSKLREEGGNFAEMDEYTLSEMKDMMKEAA